MKVWRMCEGASLVLYGVSRDGGLWWWCRSYLTRSAQYALARATSASGDVEASLRHCEAWKCLRCGLGLARERRVKGVESVEARITDFERRRSLCHAKTSH